MTTDTAMQNLFNRLHPEVGGEREAIKIALEEVPPPWVWQIDEESFEQPVILVTAANGDTVYAYEREGDGEVLHAHFMRECRFAMLICAAVNAYQEPTP